MPVLKYINILDYSTRAQKIPGGECHRHGKGLGKEMMRFGLSIIFGSFSMDAGMDVQINHGSSAVHGQWFSHQKIRADDHDIII